jgi:hypothetical protein
MSASGFGCKDFRQLDEEYGEVLDRIFSPPPQQKWEPEHTVTGIAVASTPTCTPNARTFGCDFCHRAIYDCSCMRSPECTFCELAPEDADFVNPIRCEESPDGLHVFRETQREP